MIFHILRLWATIHVIWRKLAVIQKALFVLWGEPLQWHTMTYHDPWGQSHIYLSLHDSFHRLHDDVIKWKHFQRYWTFVRGIHWIPVNSPHKGQWCRALIFTLICTWINSWVKKCEAGDLKCHRAHYDVIAMDVNRGAIYWEIQIKAPQLWHICR